MKAERPLSKGEFVTRSGSDVQCVAEVDEDGFFGTFVCIVAPHDGWCSIGDVERNLCRRYVRVKWPSEPEVRSEG